MHSPIALISQFDTPIFLSLFILSGRLLETMSRSHTGSAISSLRNTQPKDALLVTRDGDLEKVDAVFVEVQDLILVPVGGSPVLDGVLIESTSGTAVDEAALTGESRPVLKRAGDELFAGTIVVGPSPAKMRVTKPHGSTVLDGVVDAVRDAASSKTSVERLADSVTAYFVPAVVFMCVRSILCDADASAP